MAIRLLSPPNLIGQHRPKRWDQEVVLPGRLRQDHAIAHLVAAIR